METAAKIRAFAYVSAEKAELYRSIMRVFMRAKERFALHLRPAEILIELQKLKSVLADSADTIDVELTQLCDWGNLEARPDTSDVSTVDDFLRRRYLYQLTVSGEAAERAIQNYEEAILQPGELQSAALSDIRDLLSELASLATNEALDGAKIHRILITLTTRFEELTRRAQSFMGGLQRRIDLQGIDLDDFIAYKNRLLDYLERFIQELIVATAEIARVISRIESSQLLQILRVVAERDLADAVNKQAGDFEVVLEKWQRRWTGLHEWFISGNGSSSHAEVLRARARSAIPALLGAIASINDRRISRIDRANDLRTLARWFAETGSDAEAHRLWRAAFGLNPSRHLSTNEATVETLEAARIQGNTSWFDAPPMQVSVRLRATGFHSRRGRSGTIIDRSDGKARLATLAAEEAVQIAKAQNRLAGLGRIRLSEIGPLGRAEFDLFLDLLGEALAIKPSVNDAVETVSSNGLLRITMEPILDTDDSPARAIIPTEDGQLSGPDHFVTIEHVFSQTTQPNLANDVTVNRA